MIFIVCILHLANALGPVRFRRCNTDLGPSLGYQNRQRVIPRGGELGTRPMVEIDVTIAAQIHGTLSFGLSPYTQSSALTHLFCTYCVFTLFDTQFQHDVVVIVVEFVKIPGKMDRKSSLLTIPVTAASGRHTKPLRVTL